MTSRVRNTRSAAVRAAAGPSSSRRPESASVQARPQLRVVSDNEDRDGARTGFVGFVVWTRSRSTSLIHIAIAALFLAATLVGALLLRTQMVENSFQASAVQSSIDTLTQDVEEDQAKLDALESSLPQKAEEMGMVLQQGALSIDLNGYKPSDKSSDSASKSDAGDADASHDADKGNTQ